MKAGRELDALVAEKVMGLSPMCDAETDFSEDDRCYHCTKCRAFSGDFDLPDPHERVYLPYSTNIGAAWQVVEELSDRFHLQLTSPFQFNEPWWAGFTPLGVTGWNGRPDFKASGDTAPLAICLAALKAVVWRWCH